MRAAAALARDPVESLSEILAKYKEPEPRYSGFTFTPRWMVSDGGFWMCWTSREVRVPPRIRPCTEPDIAMRLMEEMLARRESTPAVLQAIEDLTRAGMVLGLAVAEVYARVKGLGGRVALPVVIPATECYSCAGTGKDGMGPCPYCGGTGARR